VQATKEEIKEALDMMALRHHPDKNRGEMSGQEAYELSLVRVSIFDLIALTCRLQARDILLKDDVRRAYYDLQNGFVADNEQEVRLRMNPRCDSHIHLDWFAAPPSPPHAPQRGHGHRGDPRQQRTEQPRARGRHQG
jgi:hypothetical protein